MKGIIFESLNSEHIELILLPGGHTGVKDQVKAKAERLRIGTTSYC